MPYIITTRRSAKRLEPGQSTYNEAAVATLNEARAATWAIVFDSGSRTIDGSEVDALPESGGTIGPLPDGTVIEVRRVSFQALNRDIGARGPRLWDEQDKRDILAAFNAA